MLRTRILTALVMGPLVLAALLLLPPRGWGIAMLAVVVVAAHEWAQLARFAKATKVLFIALLLAVGLGLLFLPAAGFARGWPPVIVYVGCGMSGVFWLLLAPLWLKQRWSTKGQPVMLLTGWIVLIGAWIALVELQARSPWLALAAMAIVWIADTAAYFSGRAFGHNKLAPMISPGKTWEGVYGGLAAVAIYALCLLPFARAAGFEPVVDAWAIVVWIALGMGITAISVVGDLYESLMKRDAGVKDSGSLLPGHGGVLDRADALLAAMPLAALAAQCFLVKS
ncbi:MAG: phosphatidate cytidylyltransferase [Betaproteobacteria bacterium]